MTKISTRSGQPPRTGSITIEKEVTDAGAKRFGFKGSGRLTPKRFDLGDGESRSFSDLKPGAYVVKEDKTAGWKLDSLVCDDPTGDSKVNLKQRKATIKVAEGEQVTCTFTNTSTTNSKNKTT